MKLKSITQCLIALLATLCLAVTGALAGERDTAKLTDEQKELMAILDTNGDGVISEAEAQRHPELAARFWELDENSDGVLEKAEFARFEVTEKDLEKVDDDYRQ